MELLANVERQDIIISRIKTVSLLHLILSPVVLIFSPFLSFTVSIIDRWIVLDWQG